MAAGTLGVLHLLDPFANFGRGVTQILRPAIVAANNLLSALPLPEGMSRFIHALPPAPLAPLAAAATGLSLAALAAWSVFRGRPYCDGLCPVGTFLGLFSSHSLLRIRFDENSCSNCGRCEAACPTACLSAQDRKVDGDRCVLCLSCVEACPGGALRLAILPTREGLQRRNFLRVAAGLGVALGLGSIRRYRKPSSISGTAEAAGSPISPPGSRSHENFSRKCIACSACVKACPAGIIRPALLAWGASGLFQPRLDYDFGYCQFECNSCTAVCPTGAIDPLSLKAKQRVQIGRAQFHGSACIVVKNGTACGACSEHCPTQAAHMVPYRDGLWIPEIDPSLCIGCGACRFACPAAPKAMTVRGLPFHGTARSVAAPGEGPRLDPLEEFPF
jgi:ferredoxin-type protein NapF